jgi:hypothetical protein
VEEPIINQSIAKLYAVLASIEDLKRLSRGARLTLEDDAFMVLKGFWNAPFVTISSRGMRVYDRLVDTELTQEDMQPLLPRLHAAARQLICGLLDGKRIVTTAGVPTLKLDTDRRVVVQQMGMKDNDDWYGVALSALFDLIQSDPFPFKRCEICNKVFVPYKKQIYCSADCARRAVEERRGETHKQYMKQWHLRKKQQASGTELTQEGAVEKLNTKNE